MGKLVFLLFSLFIGAIIITGPGCANIIPPSGGPKDTLPPVLISAFPKDSTAGFNAKRIILTFNEYVQLDNNLGENLIVSPYPVLIPTVESKLRVVTVLLKDSLKPNTTYSIDFGKAIKDVNEGNIAKNFTYVFSTGARLDQGKITGKVLLAETGKPDSTLLVVLHSNLSDTSIKKNNPAYITRVDNKGNFTFRNLASGPYHVFVLPNEYSKKYDDSTKMFAFLPDSVVVYDSSSAPKVELFAYRQFKPKEKKGGAGGSQPQDKKKPKKDTEKPKLRYTTSVKEGPQDLLKPFSFNFNTKVDSVDTAKIVLVDTNFHSVKGYSFAMDTSLTKFDLNYQWPENTDYKIIVQQTAFKDSNGTTIAKTDTITFKTRRESEYGSIRLHFTNLKLSKNPVVLLLLDNKIAKSVPLTTNEWYQQLFTPGEYELHILYDDNKNGVWDPGDYKQKKQPEIVDFIPRKVIIKANNEADIEIVL